jgi:uncharacterized protein YndB with AHSA1/START domain
MTTHDTLVLERRFDAPPARVFELWSDEPTWRRWFRMPGSAAKYAHDFRPGGLDEAAASFAMPDGRVETLRNRAMYLAIEDDRRIVQAYVAIVDDTPRWSSLVTVELDADGAGTRMSWTEQVAVLHPDPEGRDLPHLRGAIRMRFTAMAGALA